MNNQRIIVSIFILIFMFLFTVNPVLAVPVEVTLGNTDDNGASTKPALNNMVGIAVTLNSTLYSYGVVTHTYAMVESDSGASTSLKMVIGNANGDLLRVSDAYTTTNTTTHTVEFTWSGYTDNLVITSGSKYLFGMIGSVAWEFSTSDTGDGEPILDLTNNYASPTSFTDVSFSGSDQAMYIVVNAYNISEPLPTATPGPLPTGGLNVDTTDADVVMSALIDYGVPVVVMLLPVLFLWLIGGRGKWPFLMGIAIGTGMGYLFGLVPVWLVFIVSIVEVGMAYQSVRSG